MVSDDVDALRTRPGQYIQRVEGGPGELRQALRWVWALFLVRMVTAVSVTWAAFVLGPVKAGAAAFALLALVLMKAVRDGEGRPLEEGLPAHVAGVLWVLLAVAAAAWVAVGGRELEKVWPAPLGWRPYRMVWYWQLALLSPSAVWWTVRAGADWRLLNEITDPNWPPPVGERAPYYGPARPGGAYDVPPPGVEPGPDPEPRGRPVPRPVRWGEGEALKLPESEIERALRGRLDGGDGVNPMTPLKSVRVASPGGGEVRFADLVTFVRQAPQVGATYSSWDDRWEHAYWGDVVDVCAEFGIVSERQEKKKTRVLIGDWALSLRLLSQLLDSDGAP